jgi:ferredoxin
VQGTAVPRITDWGHLNLNYKVVARIDPGKCIQCNLCHIAVRGRRAPVHPAGSAGRARLPRRSTRRAAWAATSARSCCPVDACITMTRRRRPEGPSETWSQRVARTGSSLAAWEASDTHHAAPPRDLGLTPVARHPPQRSSPLTSPAGLAAPERGRLAAHAPAARVVRAPARRRAGVRRDGGRAPRVGGRPQHLARGARVELGFAQDVVPRRRARRQPVPDRAAPGRSLARGQGDGHPA